MVRVLAIGPKVRGFKPGRNDEFLDHKNPHHTFLQRGSIAVAIS
jgi:hypothetical protein